MLFLNTPPFCSFIFPFPISIPVQSLKNTLMTSEEVTFLQAEETNIYIKNVLKLFPIVQGTRPLTVHTCKHTMKDENEMKYFLI